MAQVDLLRKLIREELRAVLKEELPKMLREIKDPVYTDQKKSLQEEIKTKIPGTLNTHRSNPVAGVKFQGNNPMANLLNETAMNMNSDNVMSFNTDHVNPTMAFQPAEVNVGSVEGMLGTARASSNFDAVQINEVPDFTGLMSKLKAQGAI
jgi:hypothetical protein